MIIRKVPRKYCFLLFVNKKSNKEYEIHTLYVNGNTKITNEGIKHMKLHKLNANDNILIPTVFRLFYRYCCATSDSKQNLIYNGGIIRFCFESDVAQRWI